MNDTELKERLQRAAGTDEPAPAIMRVAGRARVLRARRAIGGTVAALVLLAAVAVPLGALGALRGRGGEPADGPSLPPGTRHLENYGVSVNVAPAWVGELSWDLGIGGVRFTAIPQSQKMGWIAAPNDLWQGTKPGVGIVEVTGLCPCDASIVETAWPVAFTPQSWYQPSPKGSDPLARRWQTSGGYLWIVTTQGRSFVVWAYDPYRPNPGSAALAEANAMLASIVVSPDTSSAPAGPPSTFAFSPTEGWHTATERSGLHSESTIGWTGALAPNDLISAALDRGVYDPYTTIERLGTDDLVVVAWRDHVRRRLVPPGPTPPAVSTDLTDFEFQRNWEGSASGRAVRYVAWGSAPDGSRVQVEVYAHARLTQAQRAEVQLLLDHLQMPGA